MIIPQLNPEVTAIGIEFLEISHSFLFFNLSREQMFAGLCSLWDNWSVHKGNLCYDIFK